MWYIVLIVGAILALVGFASFASRRYLISLVLGVPAVILLGAAVGKLL